MNAPGSVASPTEPSRAGADDRQWIGTESGAAGSGGAAHGADAGSAATPFRRLRRGDSSTPVSLLTATGTALYITLGLYNHRVMHRTTARQLDSTFSALADPTRRAIVARLAL